MLYKRNLKHNKYVGESLNIFLSSNKYCVRGNIEDSCLMQYIINDIHILSLEMIFVWISNVLEFKQKLKFFEKIGSDYDNVTSHKDKPEMSSNRKVFVLQLTFNYGQVKHKSRQFKDKEKGPCCFNFTNIGKMYVQCDQPGQLRFKSEQSGIFNIISRNSITKLVIISSLDIFSLVDTGREKALLKEFIYRKFSAVSNLEYSIITLTRLGNNKQLVFFF